MASCALKQHLFSILSCFIYVLLIETSESKELVFVNMIWRHGDRSYIESYPNDPFRDTNIWKNGPGQLTDIGMKQQYELGEYLRSRYDDLLSKEYFRKEIYIRSTDKDRTIMSAQSNMAGLYPPTNTDMWNGSSTVWQPIPVHVVPLSEDKLLRYPILDCPKYDDIIAKIRSSAWFLEHERNYADFYKFLQNKTGLAKSVNLLNVWEIEDNLFCLQSNNYTLPSWATPEILAKLKHLNSLEMGLMFTDIDYKYRKTISRMQGGVLLKQILQNLSGHIDGRTNYSAIAYSAHDTTLTTLLVTLGSYDWKQPPYASCVMIELYKEGDTYFVEVLYKKRNANITKLKFYNCDLSCPLEQFQQIAKDLIPDDRDKLCGKSEDNTRFLCDEVLLIIALCMFVLIITYAAFYVYCKKSKKDGDYSRVSNEYI